MNLHPAILDVANRRDRLEKALRSGQLGQRATAGLLEDYAFVYKDGDRPVLGLGHSGSADRDSADDQEHSLAFTLTTLTEDRDGDVVVPLGCRLNNYAKNPVVFFGHQEWEVPIAQSRSPDGRITVYPEEQRIRAKAYFDAHDEDAMFIYGKVKRGLLNATSIAFVPIEATRREHHEKAHRQDGMPAGWYFKTYDMTEWSVVGVPSNAGAIRDALDREKSFIRPRLQKALGAYAAQAKGCWNGWCPCPPCEQSKPSQEKSMPASASRTNANASKAKTQVRKGFYIVNSSGLVFDSDNWVPASRVRAEMGSADDTAAFNSQAQAEAFIKREGLVGVKVVPQSQVKSASKAKDCGCHDCKQGKSCPCEGKSKSTQADIEGPRQVPGSRTGQPRPKMQKAGNFKAGDKVRVWPSGGRKPWTGTISGKDSLGNWLVEPDAGQNIKIRTAVDESELQAKSFNSTFRSKMQKAAVNVGDTVEFLSGEWKGETGKVVPTEDSRHFSDTVTVLVAGVKVVTSKDRLRRKSLNSNSGTAGGYAVPPRQKELTQVQLPVDASPRYQGLKVGDTAPLKVNGQSVTGKVTKITPTMIYFDIQKGIKMVRKGGYPGIDTDYVGPRSSVWVTVDNDKESRFMAICAQNNVKAVERERKDGKTSRWKVEGTLANVQRVAAGFSEYRTQKSTKRKGPPTAGGYAVPPKQKASKPIEQIKVGDIIDADWGKWGKVTSVRQSREGYTNIAYTYVRPDGTLERDGGGRDSRNGTMITVKGQPSKSKGQPMTTRTSKSRTARQIQRKGPPPKRRAKANDPTDAQMTPGTEISDEESTDQMEAPYVDKPSAVELAKLYAHAKAEADYLDEALKGMDHPGISDFLTNKYKAQLEDRMETLKAVLGKFHAQDELGPDEYMDKLCKALDGGDGLEELDEDEEKAGFETDNGTGEDLMLEGEAGLADEGIVPDTDLEDEVVEADEDVVEELDEVVEEAADDEVVEEMVDEGELITDDLDEDAVVEADEEVMEDMDPTVEASEIGSAEWAEEEAAEPEHQKDELEEEEEMEEDPDTEDILERYQVRGKDGKLKWATRRVKCQRLKDGRLVRLRLKKKPVQKLDGDDCTGEDNDDRECGAMFHALDGGGKSQKGKTKAPANLNDFKNMVLEGLNGAGKDGRKIVNSYEERIRMWMQEGKTPTQVIYALRNVSKSKAPAKVNPIVKREFEALKRIFAQRTGLHLNGSY